MKIATITCHDVYNHGSSLQAYALSRYLGTLGHDVRIIDYKPDNLSNQFQLFRGSDRYRKFGLEWAYILAKLPGRLRILPRKKAFDQFKDRYLVLTDRKYHSNAELKADCPEADLFIAGSDQIWNTIFRNGTDPSFYLDFVPESKMKVSYAASFATDKLREGTEDFVISHLSNFDSITVRETSGCKLAESLGFKVKQVVDPVFLLTKDEWEQLASSESISTKPYLLVYDFQISPAIKDVAKRMARHRGLEIVSVSPFRLSYAKKNFINIGPIEFLNLMRHADCVISNSFHGTAFSIIFEKDFFVVNREDGLNTRMKDFLEKYDLSDRMISPSVDSAAFSAPIDYSKVRDIIIEDTRKSEKEIATWIDQTMKVLLNKS